MVPSTRISRDPINRAFLAPEFTASTLAQAVARGADGIVAHHPLIFRPLKAVLADLKRVVPGYDAAQGYELAGFAWFQGWNDMVDPGTYPNRDKAGGYDAYSVAMAHFIRDVRRDLGVPKLPFVIGVMGVGGPTADYGPDEPRHILRCQVMADKVLPAARLA